MKKEKFKRIVQVVLNKLTPQNFSQMHTVLEGLKIDREEKLTLVMNMIYERAVTEPIFSVLHANMCKHFALTKVPLAGHFHEFVSFRKLLRKKCQREFNKYLCDELERGNRLEAIEKATSDERKNLQLEYEDEKIKRRDRRLGNIRFIGELFKVNLLSAPIIHRCLKKLLDIADEESLDCLGKLLKTVGKELEDKESLDCLCSHSKTVGKEGEYDELLDSVGKHSKTVGKELGDKESLDCSGKHSKTIGKELEERRKSKDKKYKYLPSVDVYFDQMQRIVDERLTSTRIRFLLQDVIELKRNNWVPRRIEETPITIDQIRKEAEKKEKSQNFQNVACTKRLINYKKCRNVNTTACHRTLTKSPPKNYNLDPLELYLLEQKNSKAMNHFNKFENPDFSLEWQNRIYQKKLTKKEAKLYQQKTLGKAAETLSDLARLAIIRRERDEAAKKREIELKVKEKAKQVKANALLEAKLAKAAMAKKGGWGKKA